MNLAYLDADIIVRGSLAPCMRPVRTRELVCAHDMGNTASEGYCSALLTQDERRRAATMLGANGGFFCARGDRLGTTFDVWEAILAKRRPPFHGGFDQPALNAAIVRGQIDADIVSDAMWFPRWHPKSSKPEGRRASTLAPLIHCNTIRRPYHLMRMAASWTRLRLG